MGQKSTRHATEILTRELNGGEQKPLYLSLHTADPGAEGNQGTNEVDYPGYGRIAIPRDGSAWTVKDGRAVNALVIEWPVSQGRGQTAKFFSIGTEAFGSGELIRRGRLSKPVDGLEIVPGMIPVAKPGSLVLIES